MTYEDALNIYTDGSSFPQEWQDECPPGYKEATNNEMELMAPILALRGSRAR